MSPLLRGTLMAACLAVGVTVPGRGEPAPAGNRPGAPTCTDRHGDPLPEGAVARLGTIRLRHGSRESYWALSPDGKVLASLGDDGMICVWDVATGKEIRRFGKVSALYPRAIIFSPDDRLLATSCLQGPVQIWQVGTGKEVRKTDAELLSRGTAFSPDGKTLATGGPGGVIYAWDVQTGQALWRLEGEQDDITSVAFSSDGRVLASGSTWPTATRPARPRPPAGTINVWDLGTGKLLRRWQGTGGDVDFLAFTPDGKRLVSAGFLADDARLWDVVTGKALRVFERGNATVLSPDGKTLAIRYPREMRLWDLTTGKEQRIPPGAEGAWPIGYCADGKTLVAFSSSGGLLRLSGLARCEETALPEGHHAGLEAVAFSPDGKTLATTADDETIRLWEAATGRELRVLAGQEGYVYSLALSPDGKTLAAGDLDSRIRVLSVATGTVLHEFERHEGSIRAIRFSPDGRTLASGAAGVVQLWDVATARELRRVTGGKTWIHHLAFTPDGAKLAAPGWDETVLLWETATGKRLPSFREPGGYTFFNDFTPDGKQLVSGVVSGSEDREYTIRVWDLPAGKEVRRFPLEKYPGDAFALSPDGKALAMTRDKALILMEMATGKERRRLLGHRSEITSLAFAPDGRTLASASKDTTALVWAAIGAGTGRTLSPGEAEGAWVDLGVEDAARAYQAMAALAAAPEHAVPFLRECLRPVRLPEPEPKRLAALIAELDNDDFAVRTRATAELENLGEAAGPALRRALRDRPSPEVRRRLEGLLEKLQADNVSDRLRASRATELLEQVRTPEARQLLEVLAGGAPSAPLTREAKASLERLNTRAMPAP
jgi:WD40 repeat protein